MAKRITEDWQAEFPGLGVYRARHLLRRVDTLLIGVCLERDSTGLIYKPTFHVHCLCKVFPCVTLTLGAQLRSEHSGGPDYVEVAQHEHKYRDSAARLARQAPLPLAGDVEMSRIVTAYCSFMKTPLGRGQAAMLYRDLVGMAAAAGRQQQASQWLDKCLRLPESAGFKFVGGRNTLETECRAIIERPSSVRETVESQICELGVANLPLSTIVF